MSLIFSSMFRRNSPPRGGDNDGLGGRAMQSSLFQRLIILHDGLMPPPTSKSSSRGGRHRRSRCPRGDPGAILGEDATLEERGEFVLYYHDRSLPPSSAVAAYQQPRRRPPSSSYSSGEVEQVVLPRHATEEAVRFADLCRALRSLPRSLGPRCLRDDDDDVDGTSNSEEIEAVDEAEVVHLGESTLVYVPLELGGDVFAVAQVPRIPRRTGSSFGGGADPRSVRDAVLRMHSEFALLHGGGGVHRSLLRTRRLEGTKDWSIEAAAVAMADKVDGKVGDNDGGCSSGSERLMIMDDARWEVPRKSSSSSDFAMANGESPSISCNANFDSGGGDALKPLQGNSSNADNERYIHHRGGRSSLERGLRHSRRKSTSCVGRHHGDDDGDHVGYYRYGGMEELFALRRERRELLTRHRPQRRWSPGSDPDELFREVAIDLGFVDIDRRLETLLKVLPITALREALAGHYDDRLRRIQGVCDATGGSAGRRSVEAVPPPSRGRGGQASPEPVRGQHPPSAPNPFVCLAAAEFMKSTMRDEVPKFMDRGKLFGMSFICRDRLILSEVVPLGDEDERDLMELPCEITCIILEHFRSFREKIDAENVQNGDDMPLSRWRMGGTKKIDSGNGKYASNGNDKSGFVAYPFPPTNDDAPINSLFVGSMKKHIWLQRVYLPGLNAINIDDKVETLVAMFEREEFAFLLFFEQPSSHESKSSLTQMAEELHSKTGKSMDGMSKPVSGATQAIVYVLNNLAESMAEFCKTYSPYVSDSVSTGTALVRENDSKTIFYGEPGMNIISIDRNENSFVLFNQHDLSSDQYKRHSPTNNGSASSTPSKPIFGLFGIGSKPKDTVDGKLLSSPSSYSNIIDCRHELATHLPLDVNLALDDVFNEIGCITCHDNTMTSSLVGGTDPNSVYIDSGASKSIELCTFLPQGWVYGRASGGVELYIVLDTSMFVTINDVQKAVTRIRERVFNDKIR